MYRLFFSMHKYHVFIAMYILRFFYTEIVALNVLTASMKYNFYFNLDNFTDINFV